MKFIKGVMWGTMISAGVMLMNNDKKGKTTKKLMKKGKKILKDMGM